MSSILAGLTAIYGEPSGWSIAAGMYLDILAGLPRDVLAAAAMAHIRTSKWFPRPAELLALAEPEMASRQQRLDYVLEDPDWPRWMEEIWGPKPEGPARRAAVAAKD